MKIIALKDVATTVPQMDGAQGIRKQVPLGVADGTPTMSVRVFTVAPGGHTPFHSHPWEHLNYILKGRGVLRDGQGREHPLTAGDYAMVSPDEQHQFRNPSTDAGGSGEELQFICLVPKERE